MNAAMQHKGRLCRTGNSSSAMPAGVDALAVVRRIGTAGSRFLISGALAEGLPRGALDLVEFAFRSSASLTAAFERLVRYGRVIRDRVAARVDEREGLLSGRPRGFRGRRRSMVRVP
jgi:hypothetical protein